MKKHPLTWIDGLVIAVLALLAAGTCVKFLGKDTATAKEATQELTYVLEIQGVRQYTVDALAEGDTVYDSEGKGAVGVISAIEMAPAATTISYPDGTTSEGTLEDRLDVYVTVTAQGCQENGAIRVGTYDIRVNGTNIYYTKYSTWSATVTELNP